MVVFDIFSKRQKRHRGEVPDTYRYDEIPETLRVQMVQLVEEVVAQLDRLAPGGFMDDPYTDVATVLRKEYGVFRLAASEYADDRRDLLEFVLREESVERVLDGLEVFFRLSLVRAVRRPRARECVEQAVNELNTRFSEHGVGYQISDYQVVRVDSQYVHAEAVKPALHLLKDQRYSGAQEEFLKAHSHFRNGDVKGVLTECLKSLESVMKTICVERQWSFPANGTCGHLIAVCFDNGLVPAYWQSHFSGLRSVLESGVPTARNRSGAHGQGAAPMVVPSQIGAYVLHQTAATIVFLVEAEKALP